MSNYKSCNHCGATIPAESIFCEICGQRLGSAPTEPLTYEPVTRSYESPPSPPKHVPPTVQPKRRIDNRLLLAVGGVAIVLTILAAAVATNQLPSVTPSTATHDAFLEKYLTAVKNSVDADKNYSTKAWEVTWINSTSARVDYTFSTIINGTTETDNIVATYTAFPTTQDATNYLNAMDKTAYSSVGTSCSNSNIASSAYQDVVGHAPQICIEYQWSVGNPSNFSEHRVYYIDQLDNLIYDTTEKYVG